MHGEQEGWLAVVIGHPLMLPLHAVLGLRNQGLPWAQGCRVLVVGCWAGWKLGACLEAPGAAWVLKAFFAGVSGKGKDDSAN